MVSLFIALAIPERRNPAMEVAGVGGGIEEASVTDVDDPPAPAAAELAAPEDVAATPEENPVTPARAAPAATAPARTRANALNPTSPEMIRFAIRGTSATASA